MLGATVSWTKCEGFGCWWVEMQKLTPEGLWIVAAGVGL
jgi:hypothetical protein